MIIILFFNKNFTFTKKKIFFGRSVYNNVLDIDTRYYMKYLEQRRQLFEFMADQFHLKRDGNSFSALILLSYMLSSLVSSSNKKFIECRDYLEVHRCKENELLFVPGKFSFVENNLEFDGRFTRAFLKKFMSSIFATGMEGYSFSSVEPLKRDKLRSHSWKHFR